MTDNERMEVADYLLQMAAKHTQEACALMGHTVTTPATRQMFDLLSRGVGDVLRRANRFRALKRRAQKGEKK